MTLQFWAPEKVKRNKLTNKEMLSSFWKTILGDQYNLVSIFMCTVLRSSFFLWSSHFMLSERVDMFSNVSRWAESLLASCLCEESLRHRPSGRWDIRVPLFVPDGSAFGDPLRFAAGSTSATIVCFMTAPRGKASNERPQKHDSIQKGREEIKESDNEFIERVDGQV